MRTKDHRHRGTPGRRALGAALVAMVTSAAPATAVLPTTEADQVVYLSNNQFCGSVVCPLDAGEDGINYTVTIRSGQTVEWVFADPLCYPVDVAIGILVDGAPWFCYHDVVSPGSFRSPKMLVDPEMAAVGAATFRWRFDEPGTYGYVCSFHGPFMRGTVEVTA